MFAKTVRFRHPGVCLRSLRHRSSAAGENPCLIYTNGGVKEVDVSPTNKELHHASIDTKVPIAHPTSVAPAWRRQDIQSPLSWPSDALLRDLYLRLSEVERDRHELPRIIRRLSLSAAQQTLERCSHHLQRTARHFAGSGRRQDLLVRRKLPSVFLRRKSGHTHGVLRNPPLQITILKVCSDIVKSLRWRCVLALASPLYVQAGPRCAWAGLSRGRED